MENKELETWLEETKAKNLSQWELQNEIDLIMDKGFLMQLKGSNNYTKAIILFNQWQKEKEQLTYSEAARKEERITNAEIIKSMRKEKEFSPKRGDRVLVWNDNEDKAHERIFLADIKGSVNPISTVTKVHEVYFKNNEPFGTTFFKHMKPLPTEQSKETDFKSQVIELIEKTIKEYGEAKETAVSECDYDAAAKYILIKETFEVFLKVVKEQLC